MWYRTLCPLVVLAALAALGLPQGSSADERAKAGPASLNELSMEVAALETLRQFDFTPQQMGRLRKLVKETAQEAGTRPAAQASDRFRTTLAELRDALVKGDDDERINKLQDRREELLEKEDPDLDDGVEVTDAARRRAPEVLRQLTAGQVAGYLAGYGDTIPDPREQLLDALDKVRGLGAKEWKEARDQVSETVARLTAGLDVEKAERLSDQVVQLLIQARGMKEEEFKKQRPEMEKTANHIVGDMGPFDVLRHVVEQALAELLSNARLPAALDARLKMPPPRERRVSAP